MEISPKQSDTKNDVSLPPPFIVGHKYYDRDGEYTVAAIDEDRITIERSNGRRTVADAVLKARIHRNVLMERDADRGTDRANRSKRRRDPSRREKGLIDKILQLEADGADHSGFEIDQTLADAARDLGYSEEDVTRLHPKTGRSVFGNEGDWAKAKMTEERLHEVVGTTAHRVGDVRRECNVYRITSNGLDELRRRG
jgi:hypothetical protein